jgi:cytochrome c2
VRDYIRDPKSKQAGAKMAKLSDEQLQGVIRYVKQLAAQ